MQQDSMVPTTAMLPSRDYYSMTQLRAFFSKGGCNFVYYLRYILGYKARYSSAAWLGGTIVHRLVQLAYHGIPLKEAHRRVCRFLRNLARLPPYIMMAWLISSQKARSRSPGAVQSATVQ